MLLRGINITSRFLFQQYFSYPEIMENIDKSPFIYVDMLDKYFHKYRFEDHRLLGHLMSRAKYLKKEHVDGVDWVDSRGFVQINTLKSTLENHLHFFHEDPIQPPPPLNDAAFRNSVVCAVSAATNGAQRRLTTAAVLELELMIFLHMQAGQAVSSEAQELIKARVEALCFDSELPDILTGDEIILPAGTEALSLPLYREGEGLLSIMRIVSHSDRPAVLTLSGSALRRTLHPGQTAFAIKKCNAFVDFLPSFSVQGSVLYEAESGGLKLSREEKIKHVPLGYMPSSWASSREFGTLVLNAQGQMDSRCALDSAVVEEKSAAVTADGSHFCVLKADGSIHSNSEKHYPADVIAVSLRHQRTAAITGKRSAVLDDGSIICHANAARTLVCNHLYRVLTCDGDVYADESFPGGRLPLPSPASAIALSEDLCAAAVEGCIFLYDADGSERCRISTDGIADELILHEHTLYYRDPKTGLIEKRDV